MSSSETPPDALPTTLPDDSSAARDASAHGLAGAVIARRYRLQSVLGAGGHAEVWDADDLLTRERVAVKLLRRTSMETAARALREISILRVLRVPGVVRLIDDGLDEAQAFIAMERIDGEPFPGRSIGAPWSEVRPVVIGLLETLGRIHAAGVVHRDLKPANVLVNRSGRPTILDFGLSYLPENATGALTHERELLGTPLYLAPEQISGDPITPRTDLYAVGVMLFQALTGRLPHEATDLTRLMRARLMEMPPSVRAFAPEVPDTIADAVACLLSLFPDDRPSSAAEAIALLEGEPASARVAFPRLGGTRVRDALIEALSAGKSVDVVGARGTGRSRLLAEATDALAAGGWTVVKLPPAQRAFASLAPLLRSVVLDARSSLASVTGAVETRVRDLLERGLVLLVDDAEQIDVESAGVLARIARHGAVARVFTDRVDDDVLRVDALTVADLGALFAGPDRVLHLREDAARALFSRTEGNAERVVREIEGWVRAGLCRWDGDRVVIERDSLVRLETGLRVTSARTGASVSMLSDEARDLLAWVSLAWPASTPALLAEAMDAPRWSIESQLLQLCAHGAARELDDGRFEPRAIVAIEDRWPMDRRVSAHRTLANVLQRGAETRLAHLVACATADARDALEVADEAVARACSSAASGMLDEAIAVLMIGLRALRDADVRGDPVDALMATWVEIAIEIGTSLALDRLLYEISRIGHRSERLVMLDGLVRAALAVNVWTARALDAVEAMPPFGDRALERVRQSVRVAAARRASLEREEGVLLDLARWADDDDPLTRAAFSGWLGRLRYRQGRFEEAAALHEHACVTGQWASARIATQLHAASAHMEAFAIDAADRFARQAHDLARRCRHAYLEARSEWILRSIAYRRGDAMQPDRELVDAVSRLVSPQLECTVALCEAAIAYRAHDRPAARAFAHHAHRLWIDAGESLGALLAGALLVLVDDTSPVDLDALVARAAACRAPGIGIQVLGLCALAGAPVVGGVANDVIERLAATVPTEHHARRMDVLSVDESLAAISQLRSIASPSPRSA